MSVHRNAEDTWFWACTSFGRHRMADQALRHLSPDRPEQARRALDRFYYRRRAVPEQDRRNGHRTDVRLRCEPAEQVVPRASGVLGDSAAGPVSPYPHV